MDKKNLLSRSPEVRQIVTHFLSDRKRTPHASSSPKHNGHSSELKTNGSNSGLGSLNRGKVKLTTFYVRLRNLDQNTSEEDLKDHFENLWPDSRPRIYPLQAQGTSGYQEAVVSFSVRNDVTIERARAQLESAVLASDKIGEGKTPKVEIEAVQGEYTTLVSTTPFDPDFDCYFVHGLKGHPLKTFSGKQQKDQPSVFWPADLLPKYLDNKGRKGRYLTFGYNADFTASPLSNIGKIFGKKRNAISPTDIESAARSLLECIVAGRPEGSRRPVFFVCHSLGGLVVCQAMVLVLDQMAKNPPADESLRLLMKAFWPSGEFIVKGITFFGTPFKGSILASLLSPISGALCMDNTHLSRLQRNDKVVKAMLRRFDQLRKQGHVKIALLLFWEKRAVRVKLLGGKRHLLGLKVVQRDSAQGFFTEEKAYPIFRESVDRNHIRMVKFDREDDPRFEYSADRIFKHLIEGNVPNSVGMNYPVPPPRLDTNMRAGRNALIQGLPEPPKEPDQVDLGRLRFSLEHMSKAGTKGKAPMLKGLLDSKDLPVPAEDRFTLSNEPNVSSSTQHTNFRIDEETQSNHMDSDGFLKKLGFRDYSRFALPRATLSGDITWMPKSCDWLLQTEMFQNWRNSPKDSILFIRADAGRGKTVLSQFILNNLKKSPDTSNAVIVPFFAQNSSVSRDPIIILKNIIYHILMRFPEETSTILNHFASMIWTREGFTFNWNLFKEMRAQINFTLYAVIDAIDECIKEKRGTGTELRDTQLSEFLIELCKLLTTNSSPGKATVKLLCTTRKVQEIERLERGFPGICYDVKDDDQINGVGSLIDNRARPFLNERDLSKKQVDDLIKLLKERSGSMYLYADLVIKELLRTIPTSRQYETFSTFITTFRPREVNDLYTQTLLKVQKELEQKPEDLLNISLSIKLMVFSGISLDMGQIVHLIACAKLLNQPTTDDVAAAYRNNIPPLRDLAGELQRRCGDLITLENSTLRFSHDTVRDYLLSLDNEELAPFTCKDEQEGLHWISLVILTYLRDWPKYADYLTKFDETSASFDESASTAVLTLYFVTSNWTNYVRQLKEFREIWAPLAELLDDTTEAYQLMLQCQQFFDQRLGKNSEARDVRSVSTFLAEHDVLNVIKKAKVVKHDPQTKSIFARGIRKKFGLKRPEITISLDHTDDLGNTMLHYAARNGNKEMMKFLNQHGASGKTRNKKGETPFLKSLQSRREEAALFLTQTELAFKEASSTPGYSSLQLIAYYGFEELLDWCLHHGWAIEDDDGFANWTPLMMATSSGRSSLVKVILGRGAKPGRVGQQQDTALSIAAKNGYLDIIKTLFEADKNLDPTPIDKDGKTPLFSAAEKGHFDTFNFLYSKRATVEPTNDGLLPVHAAAMGGHLSILQNSFSSKADLLVTDKHDWTILHFAAQNGHLNVVQFCSDFIAVDTAAKHHDAEKGMSDEQVKCVTPLSLAIQRGHDAVISYLTEKGAKTDTVSCFNDTILHLAAGSGKFEAIRRFIDGPLDPMALNRNNQLPLHRAATTKSTESVGFLHKACSDTPGYHIDLPDCNGRTALHLAISSGNLDVVNKLLSLGADIGKVDELEHTSLDLAAGQTKEEVFDRMLDLWDQGNDLTAIDGSNALTSAVSGGNAKAAQKLISWGANLEAEDWNGRTALAFAVINDDPNLVFQLMKDRADLLHLDRSGFTILDRLKGTSFSSMIDPKCFRIFPSTRNEPLRKDLTIQTIRQHLQRWETWDTKSQASRQHLLFDLAGVILDLNEPADEVTNEVKTLVESCFIKLANGNILSCFPCRNCAKNKFTKPLLFCKSCWGIRLLCNECHAKQNAGNLSGGCLKEHGYEVVGDQHWWLLPDGSVNEQGDSLDKWIEKLRKKYLSISIHPEGLSDVSPDKRDSFRFEVRENISESNDRGYLIGLKKIDQS